MSILMSESVDQTIKRKRGRPPKNGRVADAYPSYTLQFQTSPLPGSPNAEHNSSIMVKMGEPDTFTPVMKVSPSSARKRRRRSNNLVSPAGSSVSRDAEFPTPSSSSLCSSTTSRPVHPQVQHNMSMITNDPFGYSPHLNTPPNSALRPGFSVNHEVQMTQLTEPDFDKLSSHSTTCGVDNQSYKSQSSPLAQNTNSRPPLGSRFLVESALDDNMFSFRLVVDNEGRAVLSTKGPDNLPSSPTAELQDGSQGQYNLQDQFQTQDQFQEEHYPGQNTYDAQDQNQNQNQNRNNESQSSVQNYSDQLGEASVHAVNESENPTSHYSTSDEYIVKAFDENHGSPSMSNSSHPIAFHSGGSSSTEKYIVPQTPREKDLCTDFTPRMDAITYNLTPQFDSMMHPMMSIDTPVNRTLGQSQRLFSIHQESTPNEFMKQSNTAGLYVDTSDLMIAENKHDLYDVSDERDARAAFKRLLSRASTGQAEVNSGVSM